MTDQQIKRHAQDFLIFLLRRGARGLIPLFFAWADKQGHPTEEQRRIWWECKRLIDKKMEDKHKEEHWTGGDSMKGKAWYQSKTVWTCLIALVTTGGSYAMGNISTVTFVQSCFGAVIAIFLRSSVGK